MPPNGASKPTLSRRDILGFNVSTDFYFGVLLFVGVAALGIIFYRFVLFSPLLMATYSPAFTMWCCLTLVALVVFSLGNLFAVLVVDPGFNSSSSFSHRCPRCRLMVGEFDHHCNIIGACIGIGNMAFFVTFLLSACLLCLFGLSISIHYLNVELNRQGAAEALNEGWKPTVVMLQRFSRDRINLLVVVFSVIGLYGAAVTGVLGGVYVFLCVSGKYSHERRLQFRFGKVGSVVAAFWRPKLTPHLATLYGCCSTVEV